MRRLGLATYLVLLAVFLTGCKPPGPRALLQGDELLRAGKYPEAVAKFQVATKHLSTNALAWNYLGLAYQYSGKPDDALRAYQQAVTLDRNSPAIRFNLGTLHLEQNRLNDAMNELTTATVLDPNSIAGWVNLGKAQLRARRVDDAERSFAQALRLDQNNVDALNYEGVVQLHRRKARDAMAYFNAALKLQPDYSPAVLNQAVLFHYYIVNKTNALEKYRDYLRMKPDAAGAAAATEAARVLEAELYPKPIVAAVTNPPPATNRLVATTNRATAPTNVVATKGDLRTNVAVAHPPATNAPPTRTTNLTQVSEAPKPDLPSTNKPVVIAQAPKTNTVAVGAAITNAPPPVEVEKPEPAKPLEVVEVDEDAKFVVARDVTQPKPPAAGTAASKTTQPAKPVTAAGTPPTNAVAATEMPPLIRPARREEKPSLLKKANPLNWFRGSKDEEKPEKVVAKKPEPGPEPKADLRTLPEPPREPVPEVKPEPVFARYPYQNSPLPAAGKRALAELPFNEAVDAHQAGKLGKAMDGYRAALRQDPRFFEAHLNLGIAAAQASDLSLALASLEDAVRLNPKSIEARYQFAMALRRANYPQDAVNELKAIIDEAPTEARAHLALANLYAQVLNNNTAATTHYQRVLELAPQHPQASQIRTWLSQH